MSEVRKRERREGSSTQTRRLQVHPREEGRLALIQASSVKLTRNHAKAALRM